MLSDSINLLEGGVIQNLTLNSGATFPSNPNLGELFLRTTTNLLYFYNGTAWVDVGIEFALKGDIVVSKTFNGAVSVNYTTEGSYVVGNVTGATTLTIAGVPDSTRAYGMMFELTNAGSNITWPASVSWLGTAPTLRASGVSMVTLVTRNGGTTWYGSAA